MEVLKALILGIIQGLTEFLPVSSSGHLEIAKVLMGEQTVGEQSLMMTVVLHFATALSTLVVFRKEVLDILKGLFQFKWNDETIFSLKIVLSMIPAVIIGVFFEDILEGLFSGRMFLVGLMLMVTAVLLFLADRAKRTNKSVSFAYALIIGIAQAIAMLPGISRSGATISTSVLLGIDREKAARFSFLMVVPLIFGKMAKDVLDGNLLHETERFSTLGIGFLGAFVAGLLACTWMIALVKRSKLSYFAVYCIIIGLLAIAYHFFYQ